MCRLIYSFVFLALISLPQASAQSPPSADHLTDLTSPAKKRHYPGGQDESDLIVLPEVYKPQRGLNPNTLQRQILREMDQEHQEDLEETN